ncbi:MAG: sodium:solute symporter [Saprospiraceae bacterium]
MTLSPGILFSVVVVYFGLLMLISWFTGRKAANEDFFIGGRQSNWLLVAIGMIGASLSGVTFISIPGAVGATPELMEQMTGTFKVNPNICFSYMQMVFGYLVGYLIIATVLMPLYYKLNLTSIYGYLEQRFGFWSYKTGAAFFQLSRLIGSSFRLYLVAIVLQKFVLEAFGVPFWATVLITLALIWVYTYRGGIKTIVITDTIQTVAMLLAVVLTIYTIGQSMGYNFVGTFEAVYQSDYSQMFFFEGGWEDPNNFFKQFFSGALIALVMTGLDQDMMQKNLSCKSLKDAQKNMFVFSVILVFANLLFLSLGALLYMYTSNVGLEIPLKTDQLYPTIALNHLPAFTGIVFFIGLIAAAYSSADSALTSLTTSFCVDFLDLEKKKLDEKRSRNTRFKVHLGVTAVVFAIVVIFNAINNDSVINKLFEIAGYTYGPLLGLFSFGIMMKSYTVRDKYVPVVGIVSPILAYLINLYSPQLFYGFTFGFLIVALNGFLTFMGLWLVSVRELKVTNS